MKSAQPINFPQTVLYNRDHIVYVELVDNQEAQLDPGYDVATRRAVSMLCSNGARLTGVVSVHRPHGPRSPERLRPVFREPFRYLEIAERHLSVNVRHLVELVEETV